MAIRKSPGAARIAISLALAAAAAAAGAAHADATLDKVKERGTITIGVLANGGVFGSLDPATQQLVGWNPELARESGQGLGEGGTGAGPDRHAHAVPHFGQGGPADRVHGTEPGTRRDPGLRAHAVLPSRRRGGHAEEQRHRQVEDLRGKPVCVSQGSSFARPLSADYGAQVKGYKSSSDSLLALRGGQCVAAVHDSTLIHPLLRNNPEWADYHAPIATEVLPANSVVWTRKGEADTIAAVDKVVQDWHRSGWLIATEKRLGIEPPQPLLEALHAKYKQGS